MLFAHCWLRNMGRITCFLGAVLGTLLPAMAQFIPDKGVIVQHLKAPTEAQGFGGCYWLNANELVYIQRPSIPSQQYSQLDVTTGNEQALVEFTRRVRDTVGFWQLPVILPSPDRKYLAWKVTEIVPGDTFVLAKADGSFLSERACPANIRDLAWSQDSKWCYGILVGQVDITTNVSSPQGNAIAWSLSHGNDKEIWISDGNGNGLHRLGKFVRTDVLTFRLFSPLPVV
jgi:hypothetical protein